MDKSRILELDSRLSYQNLVSEADRHIFLSAINLIDSEIEKLKFELMLDDMLASELPLKDFLKKFNIP